MLSNFRQISKIQQINSICRLQQRDYSIVALTTVKEIFGDEKANAADLKKFANKLDDLLFDISLGVVSKNDAIFEKILLERKQEEINRMKQIRGNTDWFLDYKKSKIRELVNYHNSKFDLIKDDALRRRIFLIIFNIIN